MTDRPSPADQASGHPASRSDRGSEPSPAAWQVVDSATVVDSPWIRVRRQRVRTPGGYEIPEYYLVDGPDIVVVLALTESSQVVLVRQYRHGLGRTSLELPAGMIDPGDRSPAAAAERELLEETGYRPARLEPLGQLSPSTARQSNTIFCFLAPGCRRVADPGGDPAEDIQVVLRPIADVRAAALRCELPSQVTVGCLFLGLERLREPGLLSPE